MTSRCVWDDQPVANQGDTCDVRCYRLWYGYLQAAAIDGTIHLQPDDCPPNPEEQQPWNKEEPELLPPLTLQEMHAKWPDGK